MLPLLNDIEYRSMSFFTFFKQTHTIKPVTARHDTSELLSSTRETVSTIEKSFSLVELTVGDRLTTGYMGDFAP
jgi:hypothetical protein